MIIVSVLKIEISVLHRLLGINMCNMINVWLMYEKCIVNVWLMYDLSEHIRHIVTEAQSDTLTLSFSVGFMTSPSTSK